MLAILTCYFNPDHSPYRLANYQQFREEVHKEADLYVIELAFGDDEFELEANGESLKQIRTPDVMWQKERLLNILLDELPEKYTSVCWMDCDIVFANKNWAYRIEESLETYKITQPYTWCVGSPASEIRRVHDSHMVFDETTGSGNFRRSFASVHSSDDWIDFHRGHVGYVWAARREFLDKHRFYDAIITGAGDLFMSLACMGQFTYLDIELDLKELNQETVNHYLDWGIPVYKDVRKHVGHTDDLVVHLWHGNISERNYLEKSRCLQESDFDPNKDLIIGDDLCWHWNRENPSLHEAISFILKPQPAQET
jgi:hypothetical protein